MWRLPECVYIGLPDERLDASSLGYRNAKKKVSNPLPGVARRERPLPDIDDWSPRRSAASPKRTLPKVCSIYEVP